MYPPVGKRIYHRRVGRFIISGPESFTLRYYDYYCYYDISYHDYDYVLARRVSGRDRVRVTWWSQCHNNHFEAPT